MATISGRGTAIGIGLEAVAWGTPAARTIWLPAISWSMSRDPARSYSPELAQVSSVGDYSQVFEGLEIAGGDIEVLFRYGSVGFLMYALLGEVPAEGGAGPTGFTHTFALAATQPSLTLEGIRGNSGNSEVFEGCKLSSATISFTPGQQARMKCAIIAETATARAAAGVATLPTETIVMGHHLSTLAWNALTYSPQSVEISIDRKLDRMPECTSAFTTEPQPTGFCEIKVRAVITYRTDTVYAGLLAGTKSDLVFTATAGTKSWQFTLNNACILTATDPITTAGVVTQTVEWAGLADATGQAFKAVLTNSSATYNL